MGAGLQIKDVAERTGLPTSTLRYYERIGLITTPGRTPSGYRIYDETVVQRLIFITRAKAFGCTLDEISTLLLAWSGGACGPVQDQLRSVVATKINEVQRQRRELETIERDLHASAQSLELHRPVGACDDGCGCLSTAPPPQSERATKIGISTKPSSQNHAAAIACSLSKDSAAVQLTTWKMLLEHAVHREPIDDGQRLSFASTVPIVDLAKITQAEQSCCQFFRFAITIDHRGIGLEVRSSTDGQAIIESVFGAHAR